MQLIVNDISNHSRIQYEKELTEIAILRHGTVKRDCLNCLKRLGGRRYGLCSYCYLDREVRNRYKGVPVFSNKGEGLGNITKLPLAPFPADAPPGSFRKIVILEWRAQNGYHLWHPLDAGYEDRIIAFSRLAEVIDTEDDC